MKPPTTREVILWWALRNAKKAWVVLSVCTLAVILIGVDIAGFGGLGLGLMLGLGFCLGANRVLEELLGEDYSSETFKTMKRTK